MYHYFRGAINSIVVFSYRPKISVQVSYYDGATWPLIINYFSTRFGNGTEIEHVMHHFEGHVKEAENKEDEKDRTER